MHRHLLTTIMQNPPSPCKLGVTSVLRHCRSSSVAVAESLHRCIVESSNRGIVCSEHAKDMTDIR